MYIYIYKYIYTCKEYSTRNNIYTCLHNTYIYIYNIYNTINYSQSNGNNLSIY